MNTYKVKSNSKSNGGVNVVESVHHNEAFDRTVWIPVAALACVMGEDGIVRLEFPARDLTNEQLSVVRELLPNLSERFFDLLNEETLLEAMRIVKR